MASSRSKNASTPLALEKTSQRYVDSRPIARSTGPQSAGGPISIAAWRGLWLPALPAARGERIVRLHGPRHQHADAREGPVAEPIEIAGRGCGRADDENRRRPQAFPLDRIGHVGQARPQHALVGQARPPDNRHRRVGRFASHQQSRRPAADRRYAHVKDQRAGECGEPAEVEWLLFVARFAAGDKGDGRSGVAAGQRDAGMAGDGRGSRDAGDDFVGDAGCPQRAGFFDQVAEQAGISSFEPHDGPAGLGQFDEPAIDFVLAPDVVATVPAEADEFGLARSVRQDAGIDQVVVQHDVGARQALGAAQREQARIAGSAADDVDFAGAGLGHEELTGRDKAGSKIVS